MEDHPPAKKARTLREGESKGILELTNGHARDSRITFAEEGHIYYIDGVDYKAQGGIGSTTFIKGFFAEFDAPRIIGYILRGRRYKSDSEYKYYRKTATEIKEMWRVNGQEACDAGTKMHATIEHFYNGQDIVNPSVELAQFLEFEKSRLNLTPYRTEWMIFDHEFRICGAIDMVFRHPDGEVSIWDWKRSKNIKKTSSSKAHFPIEHLPDCNHVHYSLQQNLYRYILEKNYGLKVKSMHLLVCHPNRVKYCDIPLRFMTSEIEDLLYYRKLALFKAGVINLNELGITPEEAEQIDWDCVRVKADPQDAVVGKPGEA
tara:strand:+ start:5430 stop:6380 length:951 start_codon:yes stop_codon:yes gene_type:complete